MKPYMRGLYAWLNPWMKTNALRYLTTAARNDLESWERALSTFEPRRIIPSVEPEKVGWVGDASLFGIGVITEFGWARFKLKKDWSTLGLREDETCRDIAWSETVAIRIGLLMLEVSTETRGRNFWVKTDNTTTEFLDLQCDITEERVESGDNEADCLSRGYDSEKDIGSRLKIKLPGDLKNLLEEI